MTEETYTRLVELKNAIEHAEEVLTLLRSIYDDDKVNASISEAGFIAHPEHILLKDNELTAVIKGIADEKRRLEQEFARL
jgi:hypothetical protein